MTETNPTRKAWSLSLDEILEQCNFSTDKIIQCVKNESGQIYGKDVDWERMY